MERDKTHYGFASYETWLVALWISNDRKRYDNYRRILVGLSKQEFEATGSTGKGLTGILANNLRTTIEGGSLIRFECDLYADLMNAALSKVNWYELAEELLNDFADERTP